MRRNPIFYLFLVLVLALSSITMAVARGQVAVGGRIVICSGYGVISVALDASGNPVGPLHPCPECLAGYATAIFPQTDLPAYPLTASSRLAQAVLLLSGPQDAPQATARGPPAIL